MEEAIRYAFEEFNYDAGAYSVPTWVPYQVVLSIRRKALDDAASNPTSLSSASEVHKCISQTISTADEIWPSSHAHFLYGHYLKARQIIGSASISKDDLNDRFTKFRNGLIEHLRVRETDGFWIDVARSSISTELNSGKFQEMRTWVRIFCHGAENLLVEFDQIASSYYAWHFAIKWSIGA